MSKINPELIDELLKDYQKPEDITGDNGILKQLTKAIIERALESELTHQLSYEKHSRPAKLSVNARNGTSMKTLKTDHGDLELTVPRDRNSEFEPQIVESLNNSLRKVTKTRNSFPNDKAAIKLLYIAQKNIMKKWTMPIRNWSLAIHQSRSVLKEDCVYDHIVIIQPLRRGWGKN